MRALSEDSMETQYPSEEVEQALARTRSRRNGPMNDLPGGALEWDGVAPGYRQGPLIVITGRGVPRVR